MAVTVQRQAPLIVLDENDTIVGVDSAAESQFAPLVGSVLWKCLPGSKSLFKPYCDAARRTVKPLEFLQFYNGAVIRVHASPTGDGRLELRWEQLLRLDVTTFDTFRTTLRAALALVEAEASGAQRDEARTALRLIEGGG